MRVDKETKGDVQTSQMGEEYGCTLHLHPVIASRSTHLRCQYPYVIGICKFTYLEPCLGQVQLRGANFVLVDDEDQH